MSLRRLLPQTLISQLLSMLTVVLLIMQIINLIILIGVQQIQERSIVYNNAIESTVRYISELPDPIPKTLPYVITRESTSDNGVFFISKYDRASRMQEAKKLVRYNSRLDAKLEEYGLTFLQTSVTLLEKDPRFEKKNKPLRRSKQRHPHRISDQYLDDDLYHPPRRRGGRKVASGENVGNPQIRLSVEIEKGVFFNAMISHKRSESFTGRILLSTFLLLTTTLLAVWMFTRRISRPLSNFTDAAERLGRGEAQERLDQKGPKDIRQAAIAFNTMQDRLTRMIDTQRVMLRAVGHDLRTPLTSLRLRAENMTVDEERDKFISTINYMTIMTKEILDWAKESSGAEELANVDMRAMLESLTDDYQDQGKRVNLEDFQSFALRIRRVSIKRALQNLIDNALNYGNSANVSVQLRKNSALIHIDDDGPGVPEGQHESILKPFVRLENSRSKETGGTGLGLSIANSIAQIHGGRIILSNRKPNGLRATLSLPS